MRWFLEHGAHLNLGPQIFDPQARSASSVNSGIYLNVAAGKSSIVIFDMLMNHGAKRENSVPLHMAAGAGVSDERIPMMTHLMKLCFDVNEFDKTRDYAIETSLQYGIRAEFVEKVRFLLNNEADPFKPIGLTDSPLKMAERSASEDLVKLLKCYS